MSPTSQPADWLIWLLTGIVLVFPASIMAGILVALFQARRQGR